MNNQDLRKMRREYKEKLQEIEDGIKKREEYEEYLKNPVIQQFLELQKYKDFVPEKEQERIENVIPDVSFKDSNRIYIYYGTYYTEEYNSGLELDRITYYDNPAAGFRRYRNLESNDILDISISETEEFESNYTIIHIETQDKMYYLNVYNTLRIWFFKELLTRPQKEVVRSLRNPKTVEKIFEGKNDISLIRTKKN